MLADVVVVRHTADRFDERAEQDEAVVGVLPARAGFESEWARPVQIQVVAVVAQLQAVLVVVRAEDVAGAAGVCEELMDGDPRGDVPVGIVTEILSE